MGNGVAFKILGDTISSPCDGELTAVFPTGHAFGLTRSDGVEVLVHIGIDTIYLNGEGFTILSKQGMRLNAASRLSNLTWTY